MSLSVKPIEFDENFKQIRVKELRIGTAKSITTPLRGLNLKKEKYCESRLIDNNKVRGINEIYLNINKQKINQILTDAKGKFSKELGNLTNKVSSEEITFMIFNYEMDKENILSQKTIEDLLDIMIHPRNDFVIPPRISNLSGTEYIDFLENFYSTVNSYTYNDVAAYFPYVSPNEFRDLCKFYSKHKVSSFIIDFNGKNPIEAYILINDLNKLFLFYENEYHVTPFIYGLNVPITRISQKKETSSAKDILTFLMGIDSFGTSHITPPYPPEIAKRIKENPLPHYSFLFNRSDYGYYRENYRNVEQLLKEKFIMAIELNKISKENYPHYTLGKVKRAFNVERHALESIELQNKIIQEKSIKNHLQVKPYAKENLKQIQKRINQMTN